MDQNKLSVPMAIVVAGVLIAGAVFLSGGKGNMAISNGADSGKQVATVTTTTNTAIEIRPISQTDHVFGNPTAPAVLVEYSDTECPFCKSFHQTMRKVMDEYGKGGNLAWAYRQLPLEQLHPKAPHEAEATECASELGGNTVFWNYINKIFEITPSNNGLDPKELENIAVENGLNKTAFLTCLNSGKYKAKIKTDSDEAIASGGRGTPYSILLLQEEAGKAVIDVVNSLSAQLPPDTIRISKDGKKIAMSGALPYEMLNSILKEVVK